MKVMNEYFVSHWPYNYFTIQWMMTFWFDNVVYEGKKIIAFSTMTLQFLLYFARSVNQSRLVTKIMIIDRFVIFIFDFSCWTIKCDPRGFLKNILRSNFNQVSTYHLEYLFTPFLFNYNNRLSFVSIFFLCTKCYWISIKTFFFIIRSILLQTFQRKS